MKIKINVGLIVLLFSVISSFTGNPIWFKWWVYLILMMFSLSFKKGR